MSEYIDEMKSIFNGSESMDSEVPLSFQVAILVASFGSEEKSPIGFVVAALTDHE